MGLEKTSGGKTFATIVGGKIRVKVEEGTEGSEERESKTGTRYELVYDKLTGIISSVYISEQKWGKMLNIKIDGVILSLNVETSYAKNIMERLPALKMEQSVDLVPYDFEPEGKKRTGITIYQGGKINSYYRNGKEALNGFPEPDNDGKGFDSKDWNNYYDNIIVKFLVAETEKFIENNIPETKQQITEKDTDEIDIDGVPF